MAQINPYINFNGNAEEAFSFYKSVFGGEFGKITRFKDIASAEFPVAEDICSKRIKIPSCVRNVGRGIIRKLKNKLNFMRSQHAPASVGLESSISKISLIGSRAMM